MSTDLVIVEAPKPQLNGHGDQSSNAKRTTTLRSTFAQVLATLIQDWMLVCIGLSFGMPAIVLGALFKNPSEALNMDEAQASWFGSLSPFAHLFGSLATGLIQERFGRKGTMVFMNIPSLSAWLILYFASSVYALYAVSLILGFCAGLLEAPLHSYIGEIAEPRLRGTLSTVTSAAKIVGIVIMLGMGYIVEWRDAALISAAITVVCFISMTQIPESPIWLLSRNRSEDAQKSLRWLRGWAKPEEVQEEFQSLLNYTKVQLHNPSNEKERHCAQTYSCVLYFKEILNKKVLLPLRMVCIVVTVSSIASLAGIFPYLIYVLKEWEFHNTAKFTMMVGFAFGFAGSMANVVLLRRCGKRKIALFSYGLNTIIIFGFGAYKVFLNKSFVGPSGFSWPLLIFLLLHCFLNGLSITLLPWQLLSEVFPLLGRGTATGLMSAWSYVVNFVLAKSFLYLLMWLSLSGVYCLYGACSVAGLLYLYCYLPETEGKTLEQIESYFTKNHDRKEKFCLGKSMKNIQSESGTTKVLDAKT